jgi:hypothetical protein
MVHGREFICDRGGLQLAGYCHLGDLVGFGFRVSIMQLRFALTLAASLALATPSYGKEQSRRDCIREVRETFGVRVTEAKRICDPKNAVKPHEYGWVCQVDGPKDEGPYPKYYKAKGVGARLKRDALCE